MSTRRLTECGIVLIEDSIAIAGVTRWLSHLGQGPAIDGAGITDFFVDAMSYLSDAHHSRMAIATGDSVTVEYTGRLDDGTIFDTSRESVANETGLAESQPNRDYSPLTFEIGTGRVIEGLEEGLIGMEPNDSPTITIPPEKGYGEWTEDHVREYDLDEFSQMVGGDVPEAGAFIETQQGGLAEISEVTDDLVKVDFNHQLAGETLEFDIEILEVE